MKHGISKNSSSSLFSRAISKCELPYLFTVKIEVSELDVLFVKDRSDRDDLHVICSENTIFIQFNEERVPTKSFAVSKSPLSLVNPQR